MQRYFAMGALLAIAAYAGGCSDDADDDGGGVAGTAGTAGAAGSSAAGSSGAAGSGGDGGSAGAAGSGGAAGSSAAGAAGASGGQTGGGELSFFVTSTGSGDDGGNVGGLEGADAKCQELADAVGSSRTWRAYLSTTDEDAVDRIGDGPWFNADGVMVAADVEALHTAGLQREPENLVLDETGAAVPGPEHDILTGSDETGRLLTNGDVADNCNDWTSNATGAPGARVGHSDIPDPMFSPSWNSAHTTPGCSAAELAMVGGAGRLYCFAE